MLLDNKKELAAIIRISHHDRTIEFEVGKCNLRLVFGGILGLRCVLSGRLRRE
jgi:hypothetical protein